MRARAAFAGRLCVLLKRPRPELGRVVCGDRRRVDLCPCTGPAKGKTPLTMPSKEGAASSIQARMRGRSERKANAAKAKAEEKAAAAAAKASKTEEDMAATRMQASIRGRASRKAEGIKAAQAAKAASGSDQPKAPEQPKKKSFFAAKDGGVHVDDKSRPSSVSPPLKRSTCAPHVAQA